MKYKAYRICKESRFLPKWFRQVRYFIGPINMLMLQFLFMRFYVEAEYEETCWIHKNDVRTKPVKKYGKIKGCGILFPVIPFTMWDWKYWINSYMTRDWA